MIRRSKSKDDGKARRLRSCCSGSLHTIIKGCGLVWITSAGRWLTVNELFQSQGWPITEAAAVAAGGSCPFSVSECTQNDFRTRRSLVCQLGNAMHVNAIGAVIGVLTLMCPALRQPQRQPRVHSTAFGDLLRSQRQLKRRRTE